MLIAEALYKSYGLLQVTNAVSLHIPKGERRAVIGPNGAGKTTFFNLLTGEIKADSGRVILDGQDISNKSPDWRARAGLGRSFQKNNLFMDLTVLDNLSTACAVAVQLGKVFWKPFSAFKDIHLAAEEI
ncbi:MAG: ATP-binding cassette domain-containing protein, partial [bacterium]|nr:ATP-binding cassette domain-containing protein [bacterium]